MKKYIILLLLLWTVNCFADENINTGGGEVDPGIQMWLEEEDGAPSILVYKTKVTNGTLTDNADGTGTVDTGGGDSVTVDSVAIDTTADLDSGGTVNFSVSDGGAGGPDTVTADYDANEETEESAIASGDFIPYYDTTASAMRKVDLDDLPAGASVFTDGGTVVYPTGGEDVEVRGTSPAYYLNPTAGDTWHMYAGAESYLVLSNYTDGLDVLILSNGGQAKFINSVEAESLHINGSGTFDTSLLVSGTANISGNIEGGTITQGGVAVLIADQTTPQEIVNGFLQYEDGHAAFTEQHSLVDKEYVDSAVVQIGGQFFMLDAADGSVAAYKQTSLNASALSIANVSASANAAADTLIEEWISPSTYTWSTLQAGVYDLTVFAARTAGSRAVRVFWRFYERKSDTSEVLIATSNLSELVTTKAQFNIYCALSEDYTPSVDSRLVGKVYFNTSATPANNTTCTLYYQGDEDSNWLIPLSQEFLDDNYVEVAGDTMTGALTIDATLDVTGALIEDSDAEDLVIRTNSVANQLVLDSGGGVGIGNAAPGQELDVTGDIQVSGIAPAYYYNVTSGTNWHSYAGAENYWTLTDHTNAIEGLTLISDTSSSVDAYIPTGNLTVQNGYLSVSGVGAFGGDLTVTGATNIIGTLSLGNYSFPTTKGSVDQILKLTASGALTFQDDSGAAGGDSISIDSVAVVDPDFVSTGDIDFVDTSNTVTANINNDAVDSDNIVDETIVAADIDDGAYNYNYTFDVSTGVLDDGQPPTISIIESTGTYTPRFRAAYFDDAVDDAVYFTFVAPSEMASGNWTLDVYWFSDETANEAVYWGADISATTEADADDVYEQAAGTTQVAGEVPDQTEATRLVKTTITISNLDSVAAGDLVTLRFYRDGDHASDLHTNEAYAIVIKLQIPRT